VTGRVAVVHERFTEYAGSERVVEQLLELWPDAHVYAPVVDRDALPASLAAADLRSSRLQPLYRGDGRYAHLLPLLPVAMRRFDLRSYDLVLTSHHAFANRIRTTAGTKVLSYTHTPARWIWEPAMREGEAGRVGSAALSAFAASQRRADRAAGQRVDRVLANSTAVAGRVRRWWGREASVVHPPVDVEHYSPDAAVPREDFFLLAGRLVPYKRPEVAAAAARAAGVRLVVAGDGRARSQVEQAGGAAVQMLGRVTDDELRGLYRRCRALLMPGEEDFGIVPVEAQACGAPVVALEAGGAIDTVRPGISGLLYADDPVDPARPLADVLRSFAATRFDPARVRRHAETFSHRSFRDQIAEAADELVPGILS
jgi:glycosyltransferase involved in cell wall biosynthesis